MNIVSIILSGLILVVVIGIYVAVSYKHDKSGLGGGCNGNCGACGMKNCHSKDGQE